MKRTRTARSARGLRGRTRGTSPHKPSTGARRGQTDQGGKDPSALLTKARRPEREVQRVNVDFPIDLLEAIDREARAIGVTRQAFIKLRLADTLKTFR